VAPCSTPRVLATPLIDADDERFKASVRADAGPDAPLESGERKVGTVLGERPTLERPSDAEPREESDPSPFTRMCESIARVPESYGRTERAPGETELPDAERPGAATRGGIAERCCEGEKYERY